MIKSAAVMTMLVIVNKLVGVFLRLYVSARIGSAGMGLYQLILSVYTMFSTFATAGFTVSVSRLAAEKDERSHSDVRLLMSNAFAVSLAVSAAATALMLAFSGRIAVTLLRDVRCAAPLRVLALSMPFMAVAACLKGWFIAKRRAPVTSAASLFEQLVKFTVIALSLGTFMANTDDAGVLCIGIVAGVTASEICSCAFLWLFRFVPERRRREPYSPTETRSDSRKTLISVTAPIALSVYVTSVIHTGETLLIPYVFEKFSGDRVYALSQFGMIRGMVIPVLFFPFAFLGSLLSVFTPEISRLNLLADKTARNEKIAVMMSAVSALSVAAGGLFAALPEAIGEAFYPGEGTAEAIRLLAFVTPLMYAETVSDGILKAIGEQMSTLRYTLLNSALRIALTLTLVAKTGGSGYLWMLIVSNAFSYFLCRVRLYRVTGVRPSLSGDIVLPCTAAAAGGVAASLLTREFIPTASPVVTAAAGTAIYVTAFAAFLLATGFSRVKTLFAGFGVRREKAL